MIFQFHIYQNANMSKRQQMQSANFKKNAEPLIPKLNANTSFYLSTDDTAKKSSLQNEH